MTEPVPSSNMPTGGVSGPQGGNPPEDYPNLDPETIADGDEKFPSKDLPLFLKNRIDLNLTKPGEVVGYFEMMEFTLGNVVKSCRAKKMYAVNYMRNNEVSRQWQALPKYRTGSWDEFKAAVLRTYPEAEEFNQGSLQRLHNVLSRYRNVGLSDHVRVAALSMAARPEIESITRPIKVTRDGAKTITLIGNHQIVAALMECFDSSMREAIKLRLLMKEPPQGTKDLPVAAEQRHDWHVVMDVAAAISKENGFYAEAPVAPRTLNSVATAPSGRYDPNNPPRILQRDPEGLSEFKAEMEQRQAQLADSLSNKIEQQFSQLRVDQEKWGRSLNEVKDQVQLLIQHPHNMGLRPMNNAPRALPPSFGRQPTNTCFYCGAGGHFASDCAARARHLAEKKIVLKGVEVFLPNGTKIPSFTKDGISMKERVDTASASINYHGIQYTYDDEQNDYVTSRDLERLQDCFTQQLHEQFQNFAQSTSAPRQAQPALAPAVAAPVQSAPAPAAPSAGDTQLYQVLDRFSSRLDNIEGTLAQYVTTTRRGGEGFQQV